MAREVVRQLFKIFENLKKMYRDGEESKRIDG